VTPIEKILQGAAAGKYGDDSDHIGKLAGLLMAARFEQGYGPFICGVCGEKQPDGHYEAYIICPAFGADVGSSAVFRRVNTPPCHPNPSIPAGEPSPSETP
jgi:hypothetical protein